MIVIAETNIERCHKDLYRLNDYTAEYRDKVPDKRKGRGIGVYVHNQENKKLHFNKSNVLTRCTNNLETLFITITNTATPITVGVVYKLASGSVKDFLAEWESILVSKPNKWAPHG